MARTNKLSPGDMAKVNIDEFLGNEQGVTLFKSPGIATVRMRSIRSSGLLQKVRATKVTRLQSDDIVTVLARVPIAGRDWYLLQRGGDVGWTMSINRLRRIMHS